MNKENTTNYTALIPFLIIDIVRLIIENKNMDFFSAVSYLYKTQLYEFLSNEQTKLWHLSSYKLFDLLEREKTTQKFEFPDFV
ncbi:MAG: hypothetical protein JXR68_06185 [Bacteroidales bacterium]|nr:hypothetical protein [Bacteroidales bacterium]